ncbi:MAG: M20 family metallopeptidase [Bacteroidales bacterium]
MHELKEMILTGADKLAGKVIAYRRYFHMHPELSFKEENTSAYIIAELEKLGIQCRSKIAGTGIIGIIKGKMAGGKTIALRAEMDALPVVELNQVEYASRVKGVMHACGHDAHMAMLLGTASLLKDLEEYFNGTILLLFQPGEELSPGGARLMIESGALDEYNLSAVIAHHVLPELETGKVGYRAGTYMASSDEIYITLKGKGGHAALKHQLTDQIYIASKLLCTITEKTEDLKKLRDIPTVLSFGRIIAEGATNVIPETVNIAGTLRTFDEGWRAELKSLLGDCCRQIAGEYGVEVALRIADGYPVLRNDEELTARAVELSTSLLGRERIEMFGIRMSSEDFSFFTEKYKALYYRVGIKGRNKDPRMLHSPGFDLEEEGLATGVANLTWLAVNLTK